MSRKSRQQRQVIKEIGQTLAAQAVTVPCCFASQPTAYALGFHHGDNKLRRRKPESFVYPLTRTAYVAGVMAGLAARALRLGLRPVD